MTINSGSPAAAAFYNSIQSTVATVLGTGGYYQTPASSQRVTGSSVTALAWTQLQTDINKCQTHQTGAAFSNANLPSVVAGASVKASDLNLYETQAGVINTNRYTANVANMTLTSSTLSIARGSIWGSGSTSITAAFQADWGTAATMAAFFNTGGEVRWVLAHNNIAGPQDSSWQSLLSSLGPFDIHGGSVNTTTSTTVKFPFNSLTTTYQTIFSKTNTTASYTANTITIQARINAAGTGINVSVVLLDGHTNAFYDQVSSGTTLTCSHLKSTVVMTGITSPTYSVLTAF
jgi:hypothetical protein